MQDVPWMMPSALPVSPSPVPSVAPSPEPYPSVYELGIPLRRLPNTCQLDLERQPIARPALIDAAPVDEPHSKSMRVFIWTLRIFFGVMVLAVPAALVWFGVSHRRANS